MKSTLFLTMLLSALAIAPFGCEKPQTRRAARSKKRVEAMVKALKSDNPSARIKSAESLANMGGKAIGAVRSLIDALGAEDAELRAYAAFALGKICKSSGGSGPKVPDTVAPALRKSLKDPDGLVRVWAALALFRINPKANPEIGVITDALGSGNRVTVRIEAAVAVVQLGPRAKGAVAALISALDSRAVKRHAVYGLGAIGPDAKDAIPALRGVIRFGGPAADAARIAIEQIGG